MSFPVITIDFTYNIIIPLDQHLLHAAESHFAIIYLVLKHVNQGIENCHRRTHFCHRYHQNHHDYLQVNLILQ